jgi:tRNA pseudouridine32 synthase/23S rRNA pseudouridine746 synthase
MTPEDMIARVLYRDGLMLVVDKPAGLAVHRGPKGGGAFEDFFDALRYGLPRPPSLAHRLDKDTSGCLVLGRHRKALAHLGLLFKHGKIGKTYWAVVEGGPAEEEGVIDIALGRLNEERGWWMKPDAKGLPSVTKWKVLGRCNNFSRAQLENSPVRDAPRTPFPPRLGGVVLGGGKQNARVPGDGPHPTPPPQAGEGAHQMRGEHRLSKQNLTWLALEPVTGRTHQLRVHCAAMGWPIVGDNIYGNAPRFEGPIQHLHAREVVIPISKNKPPVRVIAPVPLHMVERLKACGWKGEGDSSRD